MRSKWFKNQENIKVGELVLIADLNAPRNQWLLEKVVEVYLGTDGRVRTVKLQTATALVTRPIAKLCLLEGVGDDN